MLHIIVGLFLLVSKPFDVPLLITHSGMFESLNMFYAMENTVGTIPKSTRKFVKTETKSILFNIISYLRSYP